MTPELAKARKAVDALRIPDAAFKACRNTVGQSLADIIERLLAELKLRRDVVNELEAEVARLTAALAGAREECAKVADSFWNREVPGYDRTPRPGDRIADGTAQLIAAAIRSLPTTEPAKAEEER